MIIGLLLSLFTLVEWNCENLFDCQRDSLHDDTEWQADSFRHWTRSRYWKKLNHVSQTILACGESSKGWLLPDVVVLTEIESDTVMIDLTRRSELRNARYEYIMTDSKDLRGIDVAILYAPSSFRPICYEMLRVEPLKHMRPTRDILYLSGITITGDTLHLFAVHAPSRYGGERQTRPFRMAVVNRLLSAIDSIQAVSPAANILITGDFNDYSTSPSVKHLVSHQLVNVSQTATGTHGAGGSYKFKGIWRSIDHIICTPQLAEACTDCFIADYPFLLISDEKYGGRQPFRNYIGPRWQNGFSDHLPLVARFLF